MMIKKMLYWGDMMKYNLDTLKKLQNSELGILCEFDKVCKQLGVNYTLSSGTLLGAVRHGGFIPWDDDIDVAMLRKDYNKFIAEGQELLSKHLFIQTYETDKNYPLNFGKIRDVSTVLIEYSTQNLKMKNGVYIDIFPIDRVSTNSLIRWFDNMILSLISAVKFSCTIEFAKVSSSRFRRLVRKILFPLARIIGTQRLNKIETFIRVKNNKKYNQYTYAERYMGPAYRLKKEMLMNIDIFKNNGKIRFENNEFSAIMEWDVYLTIMYDNYMKLPPKDERKSHHDFINIKFSV